MVVADPKWKLIKILKLFIITGVIIVVTAIRFNSVFTHSLLPNNPPGGGLLIAGGSLPNSGLGFINHFLGLFFLNLPLPLLFFPLSFSLCNQSIPLILLPLPFYYSLASFLLILCSQYLIMLFLFLCGKMISYLFKELTTQQQTWHSILHQLAIV